ncbi:MAG: protoporphyrinogen oxidase [Candidatus Limnocylindrales bacterium]|nr:protoporphyrinogen oxidase [Candidatus Limnocylindrales bacterium]
MTVLVVGGGISGLTAAYALGRAGIPTMLVEATDRLGGKVRTERVDGFLVESGPDSFISYRPAALELARELSLGDAIIGPTHPRTVWIRSRGRFVQLPEGMGLALPTRLGPFIATDMFSPLEKLRIGLDLVLPRDGLGRDVSVGAFLRRRLGGVLVDRLAGPLLGGVYGTPIDELSLDAVVPQLREAERRHRSLLLAGIASGRAAKVGGSGSPFVSLAGGMGQLSGALVEAIEESSGVEVRMKSTAVTLVGRGGGFDVRFANGELLRPEAVVLASPGPVTAGLLDEIAPAAAAHVRSITHSSTAVVSLGYRLDQFPKPPSGHGFLVAEGEPLAVDACTMSSLKWAGRAPDGTVLLRVFIGSRSPGVLAGSDAEIVALVERDLALAMGVHAAPILARVARWIGQMPNYTVGHLERVAGASAALAGLPNLAIAGAAFRGIGVPDCVAQGRAAAARVGEVLSGGVPGPAEAAEAVPA